MEGIELLIRWLTALSIIFITLVPLTGCSGIRELNEIGIVTAMGVDKAADGNVQITVLAVIPTGNPTTMPTDRTNTWIGIASGSSLDKAVENLMDISTRKLVWLHNRLFIIGESMARSGLKDIVDYVSRSREIRYTSYILTAEGDAKDLLQSPADIQKNLPMEIEGIIRSAVEKSGTDLPRLRDFILRYTNQCSGNVTGAIGHFLSSRNTFSTNREMYKRMYPGDIKLGIVFINGSAVYKTDRMLGWLNEEETRGYLLIIGKLKKADYRIECTDGKGYLVFEIRTSKSRVIPDVTDNKIVMNIELKVGGDIVEQSCSDDLMDLKTVMKLQDSISEKIKSEMETVVKKAQNDYRCDFLCFGETIFKKRPGLWRKIENEWERTFPNVQVKYDVKVVIKRTGEITNPIVPVSE